MYLFILGFFIFNFLVTAGYSDILRLYSDRAFKAYAVLSTVVIFFVFFTFPSIMVKWKLGVFIYELIGFTLYIKDCLEYNKNEKYRF
jgi:hypothetical protein